MSLLEHPWAGWLALWHAGMSLAAALAVLVDKSRARRGGARVPESRLVVLSALGGWPGAWLAMLLVRHKTAKGAFQLKFAGAVLLWFALVAAVALAARR